MRIEVSVPSVYPEFGSECCLQCDEDARSECSANGVSQMSVEGDASLPSSRASSISSEPSRILPLGAPKEVRGQVKPMKFKTQLCGYFIRGEACPFDPFCAFAHGEDELRTVEVNAKDGVCGVNTLPRTLVYHEVWVATTKYTRKTGPANGDAVPTSGAGIASPPKPSFMKKQSPSILEPTSVSVAPLPAAPQAAVRRHNPYAPVLAY